MFRLDGKAALITGASGGIGAAIARTLHAQGAAVALSGTKADTLAALAAELGERAFTCPADLRDPGGARRADRRRRGHEHGRPLPRKRLGHAARPASRWHLVHPRGRTRRCMGTI